MAQQELWLPGMFHPPCAGCDGGRQPGTEQIAEDCADFGSLGKSGEPALGGLSDHPHASNILSWPLGLSAADQDFVEVTDGSVFDGINALFGADQRRG